MDKEKRNDNESANTLISYHIVNSLLESVFDVLDADGKKSILTFANLPELIHLKEKITEIPLSTFVAILQSITTLLQHSNTILYEIGRKFSFYLDPFGSEFSHFIRKFNDFIKGDVFSCTQISNHELDVQMNFDVPADYLKVFMDKWVIIIYKGFITEAIKKTIDGEVEFLEEAILKNKNGDLKIDFKIKTENVLRI